MSDPPERSVAEIYVLGFAEYLARLACSDELTELVDGPRGGPDCMGARFTVRNGIGELFVVDVEHVRGERR